MNIHLVSIGGSIMHNLALELHSQGHNVTGSDDEIYNPAQSRLKKAGILPKSMGWHVENIHKNLDVVILGMHARINNPELLKAQELGLPVYSFPEYIYNASKDKNRIAVCGSHGKTTTTSMILHVLKELNIETDYLVGAQLEGFDRMVKLTDAPILTVEGDEYLSSALDRRPKMLHYHPQLAVITGIAWDHINVFKTFDIYKEQFRLLIDDLEPNSYLVYYADDKNIVAIIEELDTDINLIPYHGFKAEKNIVSYKGKQYKTSMFGAHNFQNMEAAFHVCKYLGISENDFFHSIKSFKGAAKRLQRIETDTDIIAYLDFAHAPSKLEATVKAIKSMYPKKSIVAFYELHTFSSFNEEFMPHYKNTMEAADSAYVFIHQHSLDIKKMKMPNHEIVSSCFAHNNLTILTDENKLKELIVSLDKEDKVFLFMTSGNFGGIELSEALVGE